MAIDVSRLTEGVLMPPVLSAEIIQKTQEASAVMALAKKVPLTGDGTLQQVVTGDPEPEWVGEETDEIIVSRPTFGSKKWQGYKMGVIVPFSKEFLRNKTALYNVVLERLPGTIAKKFDATAFGWAKRPGEYFDQFSASPVASLMGDSYDQLIAAKALITAADGSLSGWILSDAGNDTLIALKDKNGMPIFGQNVLMSGELSRILGAAVKTTKAAYHANADEPDVIGYAGAWSDANYGIIENMTMSLSTEATIKDGDDEIHLWQRDMVAVRVTFEAGFRVKDTNEFVQLTNEVEEG